MEVVSKLDLVYTTISFFHLRRKLGSLWPPGDATHLSTLHSPSVDTSAGQRFILQSPRKGVKVKVLWRKLPVTPSSHERQPHAIHVAGGQDPWAPRLPQEVPASL